jgi:hypothetical protein
MTRVDAPPFVHDRCARGEAESEVKDFYEIDDWKQSELLIELIERFGRAHVGSLEELAEREGKSPDMIWAKMCKERGIELCTIPERVSMAGRA